MLNRRRKDLIEATFVLQGDLGHELRFLCNDTIAERICF